MCKNLLRASSSSPGGGSAAERMAVFTFTTSTSLLADLSQFLLCPNALSPRTLNASAAAACARLDSSNSRFLSRDSSSDDDDTCSSWNLSRFSTFSTSFQRAASSTADYTRAQVDLHISGTRKERDRVEFPSKSDAGITTVEDGIGKVIDAPDICGLGLKERLVEALAKRGITHLFPIQEAVLKPAMEGTDIIARARTGTDQTLAYGIPIIQCLLEHNNGSRLRRQFGRAPGAIVLVPTQELAMHVEKEFMEFAPYLLTICLYGGEPIISQQQKLQKGADIIVGTLGRVADLLECHSLVLSEVRYMILDGADEILVAGSEEHLEKIFDELPIDSRSMMFSATMPLWVSRLANRHRKSPLTIDLWSVGSLSKHCTHGKYTYGGSSSAFDRWRVQSSGDELISQAEAVVLGAAVAEPEFKAIPDLDYLQELLAIQQQGPTAIGFFGTRNMGFTHQQLIEVLSYAMVITKNHIYTSGASGTNAAVIRGALRAERPDLLTVILPQSLKKQPPESQELLSKVQNVIEMPDNDHLPLIEASRICNMDILAHVQQVICFAFHDSNLLLETCREAKGLRKIVTLFYLD